MSQCVPSWDLDDNSFPLHVPSYEVAELTWQNGQLALHGLANKPPPPQPHAVAGTLESIVNQTALHFDPKSAAANGLWPWFHHREQRRPTALATDALVPVGEHAVLPDADAVESTRVGSCSGATVPGSRSINGVSRAATWGRGRVRDGRELTATETTTSFDTFGARLCGVGCTSASVWSQENSSSGKEYAKTTSGEDRDSVSHSTPQIQTIDDEEEVNRGKNFGKSSSGATKRSRAAAIHSQSERRRRDRINQRMKTLQKMVPNSSKADKASMLDEVIEYIKQLEAQAEMAAKLCMSSQLMMMQQYLLHYNFNFNFNAAVGRTMGLGMPPPPPPFMLPVPPPWNVLQAHTLSSPPDFLSTLFSNPMGIDAYSRVALAAAMYQQYPPPSLPKK